ncbi:MAG: AAA family ATPase, partial [Clostridia bacterium]|nr:AAA family ATPase [Clostridia bacterium]
LREKGVQILVNTTPVGMYPQCDACPMDSGAFPHLQGVLDVVYNPLQSRLVQQAEALGILAAGGLPMLVAQAKYAAERFLGTSLAESAIPDLAREIWAERANLVLIGMPGSGKTRIGKALAQRMGRPFVDMDQRIVQEAGKPIGAIFAEAGEEAFRELEEAAIARLARETGQVIATGGGCILRRANTDRLRQNGVLIHVRRPLPLLEVGKGRPLSPNRAAIAALWQDRAPLYAAAAHSQIDNNGALDQAIQKVYDAFLAAARPPQYSMHERNSQP